MNKFKGTGVALITPFDKNDNVDYTALKKLVEFQIKNGINYLVILGTTGESVTLNKEEREKVIQTIIKTNDKRLPLVLGMGSNNTKQLIEDIKNTDLSNIDAILSVSPYYNKPTQEGIYQHFKAVAQATEKDIILYNVPHRTGKNIETDTVIRLANDFNNIIGVKDAADDIKQIFELVLKKPKDFLIISGDDDLALSTILTGGSGVISVIAQGIPKSFSKMINFALEDKNKEAQKIFYKVLKVSKLIYKEGNPAGIKVILNHKGICETNVRLPLVKASTELYNEIIKEL